MYLFANSEFEVARPSHGELKGMLIHHARKVSVAQDACNAGPRSTEESGAETALLDIPDCHGPDGDAPCFELVSLTAMLEVCHNIERWTAASILDGQPTQRSSERERDIRLAAVSRSQ
jgi:hypothetical protein